MGMLPAAGEVEDGGGEGETDEDVDEIVIAEIDGRKPEAEAREGVETEAPFFVPAIEEKHVRGDGAVKAGEDVNAVTAEADHGGVPMSEIPAGEGNVEFAGHGEVGTGGGNEGVAEKADSVDGEKAEVEAFEEREGAEEIPEHGKSEIGNEKHVAEAEGLGEERADVGFETEAEILADEEGVDVAEGGIEERAAVDFGNDGGHVPVGEVHDDGVVEKAEAPSPLMRDAGGEIDEESGDEEEGKIEKRERIGETGGTE